MMSLDHPHILRILDFSLQQRIPFIVMTYIPNGSLRFRHPKGVRLPLATIVAYTMQIAAALQYIHEQQLIHRDLKPENLLVGRNNEILLSDFGIAAIAHNTNSMPKTGESGTVHYMAPEQLQGKSRVASDQYALGILVYEWLCGKRPFEGTYMEIANQHIFATPPSIRNQFPDIPSAVEDTVLKALEKDPHQRFATVQEFAQALETAYQQTLSNVN